MALLLLLVVVHWNYKVHLPLLLHLPVGTPATLLFQDGRTSNPA